MGILEVACMPVRVGVDATDNSTPEGQIADEIFSKAIKQPGARTAYWAHEIENPTRLWVFMDWNSLEDHQAWQKHPDNVEVMAKLQASYIDFSAGPLFVKHVTATPSPVGVLDTSNAPVVEVLMAYFPADITDDQKAAISATIGEFAKKALVGCPDFKGAAAGWGVENDFPLLGGDDASAEGYAAHYAFIGWSSLEGHQKCRETDAFKDNIHLLRTLPGLVKLSVGHVSCKSAKA